MMQQIFRAVGGVAYNLHTDINTEQEPSRCTELLLFLHRPFGRLTVILPYRKNSFTSRNE